MKNNPLISVIIPVFNGEKYLVEAIESILAQSYVPLEIILIDDGSTDTTSEIAKQYNEVNYHFRQHRGLSATLNYGIAKANGDFFAFLDADDIWIKDKLVKQMKAFNQHPNIDMVFGHFFEFNSPDISIADRKKVKIKSGVYPGHFKGAMLIKERSFFKVGLFDNQWIVGDFIDWYKRSLEKGLKSFMIPEVVFKRRVHKDNMGIREKNSRKDFVHILKNALDRQKKERINLINNNDEHTRKNK